MKLRSLPLVLVALALLGCGEAERFADYDNEEEVAVFYASRQNEKVLAELEKKKEELTEKLAEPGEEEDSGELEEDLADTNRRLGNPEFFTYNATMADLPGDLSWEEGLD
ncbi:MAG: hypothetical protein QGH41_11595, partial [Roseibacillus sp.]|nr:hypothetical protein [Roseibacillus sp.]